jgi:hypothetical protein
MVKKMAKTKISIDTSDKRNKLPDKGTNAFSTLRDYNDLAEPPLITYYARIIDNLTGAYVTNYYNAMDGDFIWYYGKVHQNSGESEYIVEFDFWNNEPAFNHRQYEKRCLDAYNFKLSIEYNKQEPNKDNDYTNQLYDYDFLYARIYNEDYRTEWQPISMTKKLDLIGNLSNQKGILLGTGDHSIVQTKLILPANNLDTNRYFFNLNFNYNFD